TGSPAVGPGMQLPATQSQNGLTVSYSTLMSSWSIQNNISGFLPQVFSGNFGFPGSLYDNVMELQFSQPLTDLTVSFCTADLAGETDITTQIRVRTFANSTSDPVQTTVWARGDWQQMQYAEGRLDLSAPAPFSVAIIDCPYQGPTSSPMYFFDNLIVQRWVPVAPILQIDHDAVLDPSHLRLHWPAPSTGFVLQRADEPLLPTWITVTEPVVELNGENTVLVPLTAGMGGFRLVLP
ncbi:MAG: hypothetical protein H6678_15255, partial [Candidatus Delongbacteria bacterium]|nr:hypothetical protein [Candidatus Delongbacteria bacterium]